MKSLRDQREAIHTGEEMRVKEVGQWSVTNNLSLKPSKFQIPVSNPGVHRAHCKDNIYLISILVRDLNGHGIVILQKLSPISKPT
jgi:hypothetical protein